MYICMYSVYSIHIYIIYTNIRYNIQHDLAAAVATICSCVRGARGRRRQTGVGSEITLTPTRCHLTLSDNQCKNGCKTDPNLNHLSPSQPASPHLTPCIYVYLYIPTIPRPVRWLYICITCVQHTSRQIYSYIYIHIYTHISVVLPRSRLTAEDRQCCRRIGNARDRFYV